MYKTCANVLQTRQKCTVISLAVQKLFLLMHVQNSKLFPKGDKYNKQNIN